MPAEKSHKRKRSIQDVPLQMYIARQQLNALKEELSGIREETDAEVDEIMNHVDVLQGIIDSRKKLKISFSSIQESHLSDMGIERKLLRINNAAFEARIAASDIESKHIEALCLQINRIHRSTSRRVDAGARMILDAVLLTIADISFNSKERLPVAIFPNMGVTSDDGVLVRNAKDQFDVWLVGNVDYGICTYQDERYRDTVLEHSLTGMIKYGGNCIMLVEAKYDKEMFADYIPQAISQAIALSEVTGNKTVRYCLSDGSRWMFLVYTRDYKGSRISYEGPILPIIREKTNFTEDVRRILELLYHWLRVDGDIQNDSLCVI